MTRAFACLPDDEAGKHCRNDSFSAVETLYPDFNTMELVDLVAGLSSQEHAGMCLYMLSSGTRRKVLLAAVLASGAALTLLDEPFATLDRPSVNFLLRC